MAGQYRIEHLEPESWWTGMQDGQLELMVHGDHIADLTPKLNYTGVTIKDVIRVANKNYLFIDLDISPDAAAGSFAIDFDLDRQTLLSYQYPLSARKKASAQRQGFNSADAIYLIVPDRFANGDAGNDSVSTLRESASRTDPSGRHGGDLQGISDHLDYIAQMGFTQIWPTPVIENDQPRHSYHGYAATNLYRVDARLGSNESYRQLVAKASAKGLGFIQDVVLNHIGSGHWWMKDLPMPDWLNFQQAWVVTNHKRTTQQDPHAASEDRKKFTDGWFTANMPDLNQRNPRLATYLIQNTLWWIEYAGLSGIRVDTYPYSDKTFLTRWSGRILHEYPNFTMVGEEWIDNPAVISYWQRGKLNQDQYRSSMTSMMDFPLYEALRNGLVGAGHEGAGLNHLYETLANDFLYPAPDLLVIFDGNHDTSRIFSALDEDYSIYQMALVYLATMRGIPQFFYGTEILMTSPPQRDDGKVRADFPGGWPGDRSSAFTGLGLTPQQKSAQEFVRRLLLWRKSSQAIAHGKLTHYLPEAGTYVYFRHTEHKKVMVVFNKNLTQVTLDTRRFHEMLTPQSSATDVLTGQRVSLTPTLYLAPRSAMILEVQD